MRRSRFVSLRSVALLAAGCCATLSASPISVPSTFNFAGNVTFTPTTITFVNTDAATTPNQATIGTGATGDYAGVLVNNGTVNIQPLNSTTEPSTNPDAPFTPPQPFISFIPSSSFRRSRHQPGVPWDRRFSWLLGVAGHGWPDMHPTGSGWLFAD